MSTDILLDDKQITVIGDLVIRNSDSNDGDIFVEDGDGNRSIHLGGSDARLELGREGGDDGDIFIHDKDGLETIHLGGNDARLELGREGGDAGDIFIHDKDGNQTIHLGGNDARLALGGGSKADADLFLKDQNGDTLVQIDTRGQVNNQKVKAYLNGETGSLLLGQKNGIARPISLTTDIINDITALAGFSDEITIEESDVGLRLGAGDSNGTLAISSDGKFSTLIKDGNCVLGSDDTAGVLSLKDSNYNTSIKLNGETGIKLSNSEETRIQLDANGDGPEDPETTSIYADGKKGSLHFRPVKAGDYTTHPLIYMLSGPTAGGGPRSWTSDEFPQKVPIIVHSPDFSQNGLIWDNDESTFIFQYMDRTPESSNIFPNSPYDIPGGIPNVESKHVLSVNLYDQKVGVNTKDPKHALDVNGNVSANNIEIASDARLKKNIKSLTGGLDKVLNMRGVRFEWDRDNSNKRDFDEEKHVGFIAQEIENHIPEAVSGDENTLKTTRPSEITPVLVEAIKDQQELIEKQENVINKQNKMLKELELRVAKLED